ncbi:MAG: hypothetical protein IH904_04690, partial [Proteobacteria bacterium]|nr:hypothetical protein [Pseudomonadota bacterium]
MESDPNFHDPNFHQFPGSRAMYRLYYAPISAAMAPQMVLEEIGAAYELV